LVSRANTLMLKFYHKNKNALRIGNTECGVQSLLPLTILGSEIGQKGKEELN